MQTMPYPELYACWEKTQIGWEFVVYHDEKPPKRHTGNPERSSWIKVDPAYINIDGSPRLGALMRDFPHNI